ncbi:MAG: ASKHA domain-containing protein [Nitrososphaeria archaeon]
MAEQYQVKIMPSGLTLQVNACETIYEALLRNNVPVGGVCGGKGVCGKCGVKVLRGTPSPPTVKEEKWAKVLGNVRLACQMKMLSDGLIELNQLTAIAKAKILTWGQEVKTEVEPAVTKKEISLPTPSLNDQRADLERLLQTIGVQSYDGYLLRKLPDCLWDSKFDVEVVLHGGELVDVRSKASKTGLYGIAFDIGTTTIVGYLYDLESGKLVSVKSHYNEQIKYGEDVISRIEFASKSRENLSKTQDAVIKTINDIISNLLGAAQVDEGGVYDIVCAGNTIMTNLLLGSSCYHTSRAPYIPPFTSPVKVKIRDLGIRSNPSGYLRTLPSISAYVGGDLVADILVSEIYEQRGPVALVDLGTNGEVVIKTEEDFMATSCAAGPALEGYSIRNGIRAISGAIESVSISEDGDEVYYKTVSNSRPVGICGSGIVEALAWMEIRGIVNNAGKLVENSSRRVIRSDGELQYVLVNEKDSGTGAKIVITQSDVRKIQVAKAAIFSSLLTLAKLCNIGIKELKKLFIAGAFGTYTDPFYATVLGLLPELPKDRYIMIGNGSGMGASLLLLSKGKWDLAKELAKRVKVVELNLINFFKDEFINATFLPHKNEQLFRTTLDLISKLRKT